VGEVSPHTQDQWGAKPDQEETDRHIQQLGHTKRVLWSDDTTLLPWEPKGGTQAKLINSILYIKVN